MKEEYYLKVVSIDNNLLLGTTEQEVLMSYVADTIGTGDKNSAYIKLREVKEHLAD